MPEYEDLSLEEIEFQARFGLAACKTAEWMVLLDPIARRSSPAEPPVVDREVPGALCVLWWDELC